MQRLTSNPVQQLRRILNDQYSFGSIIKELIQNADDSRAIDFHLGWVPHWPPDTHPLLTGPSLLCLNDGEFRKVDATAICRLDEGAKGADSGTIGKYGLGMKSVFHLCEGFFYAASADQPAAEGRPFVEFLNPWPEGGPHDAWADTTRARQVIIDCLSGWHHEARRWFCLVIPLRTPGHLEGAEAILPGHFPRIEDLLEAYEPHELATLTTLLRYLSRISIWRWDDAAHALTRATYLSLASADTKRRLFPELAPGTKNLIQANVVGHSSPDRVVLRSCGVESLDASPVFDQLKANPRWPKNFTLNPVTGRSEDALEKAAPHAAAVWTMRSEEPGQLRVRDTVFLPLSKGERERLACKGNQQYELLLHGLFFLDAGRRELYARDPEDRTHAADGLQESWNRNLLECAVLPLVLPALEVFANTWALSDSDLTSLTAALSTSNLFSSYRHQVCSSSNWVRRVNFASAGPTWGLVDSDKRFYEVPALAGRTATAVSLFGALQPLCQSHVLVEQGCPRLTRQDAAAWADAEPLLLELLKTLDPQVLTTADGLLLAAEFWSLIGNRAPGCAVQVFANKLRRLIAEHGVRALESVRDEFGVFLAQIPKSSWVRLGPLEKDAAGVFRELNDLRLDHAVIPADLAPNTVTGDILSLDEAATILAWLERTSDKRSAERTASVALSVIAATGGTRDEKLARLGEVPVLLARGKEAEERKLTWRRLNEYFHDGRLFAGGSTDLPLLQEALREPPLSLYEPRSCDAFNILFDAEPRRCTPGTCVNLLIASPALRSDAHREPLFQRLLAMSEAVDESMRRKALRYVLHASAENTGDLLTSLLTGESLAAGGVLSRVARAVLDRQGLGWLVVPDRLCKHISDVTREDLGLKRVDGGTLTELLKRATQSVGGLAWMAELSLSVEEAELVLWALTDRQLWRTLPLHSVSTNREGQGSRFVALTDSYCFLEAEAGETPFQRVAERVTLIRRPSSTDLLKRYQDAGIETWGPHGCLAVAVHSDNPPDLAEEMLEALAVVQGPLDGSVLEPLRRTPWLPGPGSARAPVDVVDLPDVAAELERLLDDPQIDNAFVCVTRLRVDWKRHRQALGVLRQRGILPGSSESLKLLAICLGEIDEFRLGQIAAVGERPTRLIELSEAFRGCTSVSPVFSLLDTLFTCFKDDRDLVADSLAGGLLRSTNTASLRSNIEGLCDKAARERSGIGSYEYRALCWLLETLGTHAEFKPSDLRNLTLRACDGSWQPATSLCFSAEGVPTYYLLDPDVAAVFPEHVRRPPRDVSRAVELDSTVVSERAVSSVEALIEYFEPWRGRLARPVVGGFLALLGDEQNVRSEAEASLHPRTVRSVRESINWEPIAGSRAVGADEDIHVMMEKQRFRVVIGEDDQPVRVFNLIGEQFEARVGGDVSSLFLGNLFFAPAKGRCKTLTVRRLDVTNFTPRALTDILLESSRILLRDVYCRQSTRIEALWRDLSEATQLQLEIVQDVILESAWVVLDQLGLRRMASIRPLARRREHLERLRAEARYEKHPESARAEIDMQLLGLNQELRTLIETDETVQREMLEAVRAKMTEFEYSLESLGFELFQNADDAVAELRDMLGQSLGSESRLYFEVCSAEGRDTLTLVHWGRPINEFHRGSFSAEEGRTRGYDTDLKKMLLLSTSDKRERSEFVTGKFGLGFKTAFFASDRPRVLSGELGFEVLGGLMPASLTAELRDQLSRLMLSRDDSRRDGTVISLPLRVDARQMERDLQRLIRLLPLMLAFSRCVKHCQISVCGIEHEARWVETELVAPGVFVGRCTTVGSRHELADGALVFRSGSLVLLIALAPEGARPLASEVPTIWVSAPTRSVDGCGVAVNGPFRVDVGRSQVACERDGSPLGENVHIAQSLGRSVGSGLMALFDAMMTDWPSVRSVLGLLREISAADFWLSLWEVLVGAGASKNGLTRGVVWGEGRGLQRVLEVRAALPTGLGSPYDGLTSLDQACAVVDGVLDADEAVFQLVASWPAFSKRFAPGSLVSISNCVADILEGPREVLDRLPRVTLETAIREELTHVGVDSATASHMGEVVNRGTLKDWDSRNGRAEESELAAIHALLREQRFEAVNGDWVIARELLIPTLESTATDGSTSEEHRRCAFAPAGRILHPDYSGAALDFVCACRGEMHAPADALATWLLESEDVARRRAGLRYLLEGRLAAEVGQIVRAKRDGTWVAELTRRELSSLGFDENEQLRLLGLIGATGQEVAQMFLMPLEPEHAAPVVRPHRVLQTIAKWWSENVDDELRAYNARIYPDATFPIRAGLEGDLDRSGWLRLFLLGCTRSMGPFTDEQHRDFLRLCDTQGWIERLTQIEHDRHGWLACWNQYIDGQIDRVRYFHWMKNLLGLSVIARFLPEYVEAFLAVDRMSEDFSLDEVANPRASAVFSGGGPDAPPLGQIIGVGQCFIMRELVRHGLVRNPAAHRWCFVPLRQVRQLICRIGGPEWSGIGPLWMFSAEIHAFLAKHLEEPSLNLGFDIPLMIVAERPGLWREIVDDQPPEENAESGEEWQ